MWHYDIGNLPNGVLDGDPAWVARFVEWTKNYIDFCCVPPLLGHYIGGIAGEDELDEETNLSGEVPYALAVFYEDGDEEDAGCYLKKCLVAYDHFSRAVVWERIEPSRVRAALGALGYAEKIELGEERPASAQTTINSMEDLNAIEDAKNDDCDLELVRLPPGLQDPSEWNHWLTMWIADYILFTCGGPPPGTFIKLLWTESPRWKVQRSGKPAKIVNGWGLCSEKDRPVDAVEFAEKYRFAFYCFLSNVNWKEINGGKIREYLEQIGYNNYLRK